MEDLDKKIIELMDLFDDEQVTTVDKIDRPERALEKQAIDDFMNRNPMAGGGFIKGLYRGVKGLQQGKIEKELMNKYKSQGMDLLEAINKANPEANEIVKNRKLKVIQDKLNETNVLTDDYVKLIDEEIKLNDPELFEDIRKFEKNNRSDLADKMRALRHPDWAEANFGENYQDVLQQRQNVAIKQMMDDIDPNVKERTVVDDIDDMNQANIDEFFGRKKNADGGRIDFAGGGMLVEPSADGRRPGYSVDKRNNNYRVTGKRGDITYGQWANENNLPQTFPTKKEAEAAQKKFYEAVTKKSDISKAKWVDEITALSNEFNTKVIKDFNKGDMSKTPAWKNFLENKKLKHGSSGFYRSLAPEYGVINTINKKAELLDKLITNANNSLKYTPWMSIQKKISTSPVINTSSYRTYIDALDTQADKASKAFDYLLNNDIELKVPKNLSKTMAAEGSLLRKVIHGLTGVNTRGIRLGLNQNKNFKNNFDKIEFARRGNLLAQGEGRTLKDIIDNADYRMKGNISWTSDIKLSNRANKNVFDYALRNFNYHQLNKTGEGTIQFYDKKTNKPINWDTLPKNKNGFRVLKPNSVYFIDANDPNRTKWDMSKIDADNMKWSKGTGSSGLFDEVFQAKDKYDNLLATKVEDPRNPKKKISFGKLMSEVYQIGFSNFGNPYNIEHADGVANNPFKNLKIASGRVNQALSSLNRDTKLRKSEKNKIFKELQKNVFNPADENMIANLIKSTQPLQSDVLVKGKTITGSELDNLLKVMQKTDPQTAKDVGMVLNSGIPIDQMAAEIAKIPGAKKFARGFMKIGGPFEVAFVGLDIANEVSKGAPLDTAVQTSLSNFTFGALGNPKKYQMRDLTDAGNELGVNTQGFQELKDVLDLEKKIVSEKRILENMKTYNEQTEESPIRGEKVIIEKNFDVDNQILKIQELEKSLTDKAKYLSQLDNIDTLYDDYVGAVQYLGRKEYNKTVDDRKNRVYPDMGTMGSDFMATIMSPIQSLLPQNLMETTNITRPVVRNLRKIPFIGSIFNPTSDAAKLSAMSKEEKNQRALDMNIVKQNVHPVMGQTMTGEQLEPYYEKFFAGGGIAKLAGVNQGPPPESGPNSQGLQGLFNRVKKV